MSRHGTRPIGEDYRSLRSTAHRAAAILAGIGVGLLIAQDQWAAVLLAAIAAALIRYAVTRLAEPATRPTLSAALALAFGSRLAALGSVHFAMTAAGHGGALVGDDFAYQDLAWRLAQHLHGTPVFIGWVNEAYLFVPWVLGQAALFYVVGPQFAAVKVLAALSGVLAAAFVYALTAGRFGGRAGLLAACATAFAPALFVWSLLDLREAPTVLVTAVALWAFDRTAIFGLLRGTFLAGVAALAGLGALRPPLLLAFATFAPLGLGLASRPWLRVGTAGSVAVLLAVTLGVTLPGLPALGGQLPQSLAVRREYTTVGARTAFAEVPERPYPPIAVRPGERLLVWSINTEDRSKPVTAVSRPPDRTPSGRVVVVTPPVVVELEWEHAGGANTVVVRHRDLIVVAGATPDNHSEPRIMLIGSSGPPGPYDRVELIQPLGAPEIVAAATAQLAYLPLGIVYALLAPFPWQAAGTVDRGAAVDTLIWYAALALAVGTIWVARRRWRELALVLLYDAGLLVVLALSEGNAGTLFRHRAFVEPFIFVLAAPAAHAIATSLRNRTGASTVRQSLR